MNVNVTNIFFIFLNMSICWIIKIQFAFASRSIEIFVVFSFDHVEDVPEAMIEIFIVF